MRSTRQSRSGSMCRPRRFCRRSIGPAIRRGAQYYRHDPAMARKLLAEAGFPEGIDIPMLGWSDQISIAAPGGDRHPTRPLRHPRAAHAGLRQREFNHVLRPRQARAPAAWRRSPRAPTRARSTTICFSKDAYFNAGGVELPGYRELLDAHHGDHRPGGAQGRVCKIAALRGREPLAGTDRVQHAITVHHPRLKGFVLGMIGKPKCADVWLDA